MEKSPESRVNVLVARWHYLAHLALPMVSFKKIDWVCFFHFNFNRAFSHDVTAAILVFQNNEMATMLVYQTNPLEVELFSYATLPFVSVNLHVCWPHE